MGRVVTHIWPRHVQTIGAMKDQGVPVFAHCPRCETSFKVNLDLLIAAYGRRMTLINRSGPCPRLSCTGSCHFLVQTGGGVPFRPLRDSY